MTSLLSNFLNNISEGIHRIKCKFGHGDRKYETCGIKYKYCDCFLKYTNFKDDLIECQCLCCNKNYKFMLLLRKGIYSYEYMDVKNLMKHYLKKKFLQSLKY